MLVRHDLEAGETAVKVLVNTATELETSVALWPTLGEYPCYDSFLYNAMTTDEERNKRFRAALLKLVRDKRVLDIGTGQDLIWAKESVNFGAKHVLAMEGMEESFLGAAEKLRSLGLQDDIILLMGTSTTLEFAPKADVCVAEVIGSFASAEGAAVVLADAKRRHLAPGGVIVPHRSTTRAAAVCLQDLFAGQPVAFSRKSVEYLEKIFDWNGAPFDVRLRIQNPAPDAILSNSEPIEELNFNGDLRLEQDTNVELTINRPGRVDGVLTWLELWCLPDEEPLDALHVKSCWASIYFPLFDSEIPVDSGDIIDLRFSSYISDDGIHPDYRLAATLRTRAGQEHSASWASPHHRGAFRDHPVYRALFPE